MRGHCVQATEQRLRHQSSKLPQLSRIDPSDAFAAYGPAVDMLVKFVRRLGPAAILQAVVAATKLIRLGRVDS